MSPVDFASAKSYHPEARDTIANSKWWNWKHGIGVGRLGQNMILEGNEHLSIFERKIDQPWLAIRRLPER